MRLRTYLAEQGLSFDAFAKAIGVTDMAVRRYAAGLRMPRVETLERIREVTGGQVLATDFQDEIRDRPQHCGAPPHPAEGAAA